WTGIGLESRSDPGVKSEEASGSLEPDAPIATSQPAAGGRRQAKELAAGAAGVVEQLEPLPGRPRDRGRDPDLADRRGRALSRGAGGEFRLRQPGRGALECLGAAIQRAG